MRRLTLAGLLLCLLGCGGGSTLRVLNYSPRFELAEQETFAVFTPVLSHERCWAFGEPAAVVSSLSPRYQAAGTPAEAGSSSEAPAPLDGLLATAQAELEARGYRLVEAGAEPDLHVSLSHTTNAGRTSRVSLHLGGVADDRFRPDWVSLAIEADPGDEVDPNELLRDLLISVPKCGGTADD